MNMQSIEQIVAFGSKFYYLLTQSAVNIEPAICNGQLPYPMEILLEVGEG